jgi:hypothetical protein
VGLDTGLRGMTPRLQRREHMTKRKVLAVATLAALPVFVGASQSGHGPISAQTETAQAWQTMDRSPGAQWAYAFGMEGEEALVFGLVVATECSFFGPVGSIACGATGAL